MIAIGGDANGSTLHGHGYTYVGSTWGAIVQILIDKQCMNPIIFIDELDKISKTEHGRELIGILTHMLDPTQNDKFQDKYFSGIDIDLSKVLFVLSYNDPDQIDRILLDRIHRIKFAHLSLADKIHIARNYTLPEIYGDMGLTGSVNISDEVVRFIVDNYTCEAGIRKLKEKLFEIVADVNLGMLTGTVPRTCPVTVTADDVKDRYFKDHAPVIVTQVPSESRVGYATGLWANSQGQGGALPIEACFFPGGDFLRLKLTGQQGNVMQESMNIAMTLAYRLTPKERIDELAMQYNQDVKYGVHVNAPGGSAKDGPSAGSCITTIVFSLLTGRHIRARFAATGEIQLDGKITAIGGLELKILGSLKAGVTDYCYPVENQRDFDKFSEKHGETDEVIAARFHAVETIDELIGLMVIDEDTIAIPIDDVDIESPMGSP
jgi:ATP-dependent Lon protease